MKRSNKMTKAEKAKLREKMRVMVKEANELRAEASEKMYDIPRGYKLNTAWDTVKFYLGSLAGVALVVVFLAAFQWSTSGESVLHIVVAIVLTMALGIGFVLSSVARSRPYHAEEHMKDFYIDELWCSKLEAEVNRLKAGIADYDRQYAEQEEYINKFRQYTYTIADLLGQSGDVELVTKAYDFHAMLKLEVCEEKLKLRLKFNKTDYEQMDELTRQFRQKLVDFYA